MSTSTPPSDSTRKYAAYLGLHDEIISFWKMTEENNSGRFDIENYTLEEAYFKIHELLRQNHQRTWDDTVAKHGYPFSANITDDGKKIWNNLLVKEAVHCQALYGKISEKVKIEVVVEHVFGGNKPDWLDKTWARYELLYKAEVDDELHFRRSPSWPQEIERTESKQEAQARNDERIKPDPSP